MVFSKGYFCTSLSIIVLTLSSCAVEHTLPTPPKIIITQPPVGTPGPTPGPEMMPPLVTESAPPPPAAGQLSDHFPSSNTETTFAPKFSPNGQLLNAIEYPVFYATNRKPNNILVDIHVNNPYTNDRNDHLTFGLMTIYVPKSHNLGSVGSDNAATDPALKIIRNDLYHNTDDFMAAASAQLQRKTNFNDVVVYIHGYEDDFDFTAERAAQLGVDVGIPSYHMFLFNWPSKGAKLGYFDDEATIDASETYFEKYLKEVAQVAKENHAKVDVIAHSMGNRALLRAFQVIAMTSETSQVHFGQIILAAPDVDDQLFTQLAKNYTQFADRTTLYTSPYDVAVHLSEATHDYGRVGCMSAPLQNAPSSITTVVGYIKSDFFGHGYFAETKPFIEDIHALLFNPNSSPVRDDRKGWKENTTSDGQKYWTVGNPPLVPIADSYGCYIPHL